MGAPGPDARATSRAYVLSDLLRPTGVSAALAHVIHFVAVTLKSANVSVLDCRLVFLVELAFGGEPIVHRGAVGGAS